MVCRDYGDRADMDPIDQELAANIDRVGWGVIAIPADEMSPGWAFTVGLWHTFRVPEAAIFGIDPERAIPMLNVVGAQVAAGARLADGQLLDDVVGGDYRVRLGPVDDAWRGPFFGTADRIYRATADWQILQCVWPDRDSRYPGETGFDAEFEDMQPRLFLEPGQHPGGVWTNDYEDWLAWDSAE